MILQGVLMSDGGNTSLQISDKTITVVLLDGRLSKQQLELLQVKKYQELSKLDKRLAFDTVQQGDRPDFFISRHGKKIGLDVTAFAFSERRLAIAQFRLIKEKLREHCRLGRLKKCRGLDVTLVFNTPHIPRPEKILSGIDELVDALELLAPDFQALENFNPDSFTSGKVGSPFPIGESGKTSDGSFEWHIEGVGNHCANSFSRECGFNLEHRYLETVSKEDVAERLNELVAEHDKPEQCINELIIVAGGPDLYGDMTACEPMMIDVFLNEWGGKIKEPQNIERVVLLNWANSKLHILADC